MVNWGCLGMRKDLSFLGRGREGMGKERPRRGVPATRNPQEGRGGRVSSSIIRTLLKDSVGVPSDLRRGPLPRLRGWGEVNLCIIPTITIHAITTWALKNAWIISSLNIHIFEDCFPLFRKIILPSLHSVSLMFSVQHSVTSEAKLYIFYAFFSMHVFNMCV